MIFFKPIEEFFGAGSLFLALYFLMIHPVFGENNIVFWNNQICDVDDSAVQLGRFMTGEAPESGIDFSFDHVTLSRIVFNVTPFLGDLERLERLYSYDNDQVEVFLTQLDGSAKNIGISNIDKNDFACRLDYLKDFILKNKMLPVSPIIWPPLSSRLDSDISCNSCQKPMDEKLLQDLKQKALGGDIESAQKLESYYILYPFEDYRPWAIVAADLGSKIAQQNLILTLIGRKNQKNCNEALELIQKYTIENEEWTRQTIKYGNQFDCKDFWLGKEVRAFKE